MLGSGGLVVVRTVFTPSKEQLEYAAVYAELLALQASMPKARLTAKQTKAKARARKAQFKNEQWRRNHLNSSLWRMAQA